MNLLAAESEMAAFGYMLPVKVFATVLQVVVLGMAMPLLLLGVRGLIGIGTVILCMVFLLVSSTGIEG